MSLNYTANTDFNGDGNFSECELDASWATLQVKKLLETSGSTTIEIGGTSFNVTNNDTFLEAVKAMVALNVSASIASDGCAVVSSLPVSISLGDLRLDEVLGYWRMNEAGPDYDSSLGKPSIVWPLHDSSTNDSDIIATKPGFDRANVQNKYGLGLMNWSSFTISDSSGHIFSNSGDWTFHAKLFVTKGLNFQIHKEDFYIPFMYDSIYINKIGDHNLKVLKFPDAGNTNMFDGTFIDLFLRKRGQYFSIDVIDSSGELKSFGEVEITGDFFSNPTADILIKGVKANADSNVRQNWKMVWFSEVYVLGRYVENLSANFYSPLQLRLVYDESSTTVADNVLTDDTTNKSATFVGGYNPRTQGNVGPTGNNSYVALASGADNYFKYDDFDFTKDFTFSFWFRPWGGKIKGFFKIVSGNNHFKINLISENKAYLFFNNDATSTSWVKSGNIPKLNDSWHHFSLIMSNGRLSFYIDGDVIKEGIGLMYHSGGETRKSTSPAAGMTNCSVLIGNDADTPGTELTDISHIIGGVMRINNDYDDRGGVTESDATLQALIDGSYFA
tara:strand:+ start:2355 stop:4028 length:1674 start_codon:yes stop_codon:yes gene_type:complete